MFKKIIDNKSLTLIILGIVAVASLFLELQEVIFLVAGGLLTFINPDRND